MAEIDVILIGASPWLSAVFGIAAAVLAERAFRAASQGAPPDRWRGDNSFVIDFDMREETQKCAKRDTMNAHAGALQSVASFFCAGAAVEAAAASQGGILAEALAVLGLIVTLLPSVARCTQASREVEVTNAHYVRTQWSVPRKYVKSHDPGIEDVAFAKEHPHQAAVLRGRNGRR